MRRTIWQDYRSENKLEAEPVISNGEVEIAIEDEDGNRECVYLDVEDVLSFRDQLTRAAEQIGVFDAS